MNWFTFETSYPIVFRSFCEWYEKKYPQEFQNCKPPVFKAERLLEFFKESGYPVYVDSQNWSIEEDQHNGFVNEENPRQSTIDEALKNLASTMGTGDTN